MVWRNAALNITKQKINHRGIKTQREILKTSAPGASVAEFHLFDA